MRGKQTGLLFRTAVAAIALTAASIAAGQSVRPAAPVTPVQPVTPLPRVVVPSPTLSPTTPLTCTPDGAGKESVCTYRPTLPTPTLSAVPIAPPLPAAPKTALSAAPARGIAAIDGDKVLSYFQRGVTRIDLRKAFGFVLIPKSAVTADDYATQEQFCRIMLASLEFTAPEAAAQRNALATYWPIVATRGRQEIETAFEEQDCDLLIAWYDHNLARRVAARAGIADMSGPLLITWPSENAERINDRNPLVVDFARADYDHAMRALTYWFRQLRNDPSAWTSRIREGTIRAGLADAINETAGVVVAMLAGKWDSVTAVTQTP